MSESVTDAMIDAAARIFCCGLPLPAPGEPALNEVARDLCLAPNCECWLPGRELTKAALEAALAANNGET